MKRLNFLTAICCREFVWARHSDGFYWPAVSHGPVESGGLLVRFMWGGEREEPPTTAVAHDFMPFDPANLLDVVPPDAPEVFFRWDNAIKYACALQDKYGFQVPVPDNSTDTDHDTTTRGTQETLKELKMEALSQPMATSTPVKENTTKNQTGN